MSRHHIRLITAILAALACLLPATSAQALTLTCPGETSKPFMPWLDPFDYTLANGGEVGSGAPGWTLRNARPLVNLSSLDLADAGTGHVLGLGSGASATSPETCVSVTSPTLRFMVRSTGSPLGILAVSAVVRDGDGLLETLPLGVVTGLGSRWRPSLPMVLLTTLVPTLGDDAAAVRFRFTTIGLGAAFEVDDVYVDPYRKG